jgi:hypothetical protein
VLDRARANAGSAALCPVVHEGARFTLVDPRKLLASAEVARGS